MVCNVGIIVSKTHRRGGLVSAHAGPSRTSVHGHKHKHPSRPNPTQRRRLTQHQIRALHYIADTIYITGENRMVHRAVTRHGLDEYLTDLKTALDGLTPAELYWQPSPNANHIAWLVLAHGAGRGRLVQHVHRPGRTGMDYGRLLHTIPASGHRNRIWAQRGRRGGIPGVTDGRRPGILRCRPGQDIGSSGFSYRR